MTAPDITRGSVWARRTDGTVIVVVHTTEDDVQLHQPKTGRLWWLPRARFVNRYGPARTGLPMPQAGAEVSELRPIEHGTPTGLRQHRYRDDPPCDADGCTWKGRRAIAQDGAP